MKLALVAFLLSTHVARAFLSPNGCLWTSRVRVERTTPTHTTATDDRIQQNGMTTTTATTDARIRQQGEKERKRTTNRSWRSNLDRLKIYVKEHGNCLVPRPYETNDGAKLGAWVRRQREAYFKRTLSQERIAHLDDLKFAWDPVLTRWTNYFKRLARYHAEKGDCIVPWEYETVDGTKDLGRWVAWQRASYNRGKLADKQISLLEAINFTWRPQAVEWDWNMEALERYRNEKGDCLVPEKYTIVEGGVKRQLGNWVSSQRTAYSKKTICKDRIERLESIGFVWDPRSADWETNFNRLLLYRNKTGDLYVPQRYETEDGAQLGGWVQRVRTKFSKGVLSSDRTKRLEAAGFVWDPRSVEWDRNFHRLAAYRRDKGDCAVPQRYETKDGINLGLWVKSQRTKKMRGKLSDDCVQRLESLGFEWDRHVWQRNYKLWEHHRRKDNNRSQEEIKLNRWVRKQQIYYHKGTLSDERLAKLKAAGFDCGEPPEVQWRRELSKLSRYCEEYGNSLVPIDYITYDGFKLGVWARSQRSAHTKNKLSDIQISELEKLNFPWDSLSADWERHFSLLLSYREENGDCNVPHNYRTEGGSPLGRWVTWQRTAYSKRRLFEERVKRLESVGFIFRKDQDQLPRAEDTSLQGNALI